MAEIELRILNGQCLKRRMDMIEEVARETSAWEAARTSQSKKINSQFTAEYARTKLKRLYPIYKVFNQSRNQLGRVGRCKVGSFS